MAGIKQQPKSHKRRVRTQKKKSPSKTPTKCVLKPFKYPKNKKDVFWPTIIVPSATARTNRMQAASKAIEAVIQDKRDVQLKDELELWRYVDVDEYDYEDEFDDYEDEMEIEEDL